MVYRGDRGLQFVVRLSLVFYDSHPGGDARLDEPRSRLEFHGADYAGRGVRIDCADPGTHALSSIEKTGVCVAKSRLLTRHPAGLLGVDVLQCTTTGAARDNFG